MISRRWWVIGSVLVMLVAVVLGWFVGISPMLALAQVDDESRQSVETQNQLYDQQLSVLKTQFEGIDELTAQLDELRTQLPAGADLPAYVTQLVGNAQSHSVALTKIAVSDAVKYDPVVLVSPNATATAAPVEPEAGATPAPTATPAATAEPAVAVPTAGVPTANPLVTADNFVAIPVEIAVDGDYNNVLAFLDSVQKGARLTTITAFTTVPAVAAAPATTDDGDIPAAPTPTSAVTGTISLYIYVLLDPAAAPAAG